MESWTPEEDVELLELADNNTKNGEVQWAVVDGALLQSSGSTGRGRRATGTIGS